MTADGIAVRDVVRDVVAEVAPEELPVVAGLVRSTDTEVVRRLSHPDRRRDPLAFGLEEVIALVTPVVWLVLDHAAEKAAGAAVDGATKGMRATLRRVFRRKTSPVKIQPLSREQLAEIRERTLETAAQHGLDEKRAEAVADALVTRLELVDDGDTALDRPDDDR